MVCVRTFTNFLLIKQFMARFLFLERPSQEFDLDTVYDSQKKSRKFRKRIFNKNSKGSHDQWVTCGWRCSWLFIFPARPTDLTVNELVDKFEVKFYINATLSLISNLTNNCSKKVVMSAFEARWISASVVLLIGQVKEGEILVLSQQTGHDLKGSWSLVEISFQKVLTFLLFCQNRQKQYAVQFWKYSFHYTGFRGVGEKYDAISCSVLEFSVWCKVVLDFLHSDGHFINTCMPKCIIISVQGMNQFWDSYKLWLS